MKFIVGAIVTEGLVETEANGLLLIAHDRKGIVARTIKKLLFNVFMVL